MIAALLLHMGAAWAGPTEERQVLAAVRALAYDRKLAERSGESIQIVVVHDFGATKESAEQIAAVLTGLGALTIQGVPVRVEVLDGGSFLYRAVPADMVLLPAGLGAGAEPIIAEALSQKLLVAGFDLAYLPYGAAMAVVTNDDHLRLVVNLPASRAAGAAFSSQLLQLAELYP